MANGTVERRILALERRASIVGVDDDGTPITDADVDEARAILRPYWPGIAFELEAGGIQHEAARRWLVDGVPLENALECAIVRS